MKTKHLLLIFLGISAIGNIYLINELKKQREKTQVIDNQSVTENFDPKKLTDSISQLQMKLSDLSYFNLEANGYAQDYFYEKGIENPEQLVQDALIATNTAKKEHPLIGFGAKNGFFLINKTRILNNKWLICDFSDGSLWGELLIKYYVDENKKVEFSVIDQFLYPEDKN